MVTIEEVKKAIQEWADKKKYEDFVLDRWAQIDNRLALIIRGKPLTAEEVLNEA